MTEEMFLTLMKMDLEELLDLVCKTPYSDRNFSIMNNIYEYRCYVKSLEDRVFGLNIALGEFERRCRV